MSNIHKGNIRQIVMAMLLALALGLPAIVSAAPRDADEREQWMSEMRQYKRQYLARELELSREQQNKFFPLYEEMEDSMAKAIDEARAMERRVADMPAPADLDYEKATEAVYEAEVTASQLELEYLEKFKPILSKRQLFRLKGVERQFNRELMRQHHRLRSKAKMPEKGK